ncbi:UDP-glucose 4-epimerase GalE, partial [Kipferlia bialata]
FVQGDVRSDSDLDRVMEAYPVEYVMHFCALSLVGESVSQPLKYYDNNVVGTLRLLEAMVRHSVPHLVFSSTAAVYGQAQPEPIREDTPTIPLNPYGGSKLACEQMIRWTCEAHGLKAVALRYFNAAGASATGDIGEDHHPETHLIPLILQVPNGKRDNIKVFGTDYPTEDGTCVRDYIHVSDLASAHALALGHLAQTQPGFNAMNLGYGRGFSVRDVIDHARSVTGEAIAAVDAPRRPGDPPTLVAEAGRAREVLQWVPENDNLDSIIGSAWKWHESHPDGFKK